MNIDWGQIVTHIIGFILAVWLLKRYAWEHLLGFVEKRRETIAASFDEIERGRADVADQQSKLDRELEGIEVTRRERIQEAAREAETLAAGIKEDARQEAIAAREKARHEVAVELEKANETLKKRIVGSVLTATEKLIGQQLDQEKHTKLIEDFLKDVKVN